MLKRIKANPLLLISLIIVVLCSLNIGLCQHNPNQTTSTQGTLKITGVSVNRINLALKEIDVEIGIVRMSVNGPFNLTMWALFRRGGSPTYVANGTLTSPPWYEWHESQLKWFRDASVKTVGFYGLNWFPFEKYETEIVFGVSCPNVTATVRDAYLSWELEQQGSWTVEAFSLNTSRSKIDGLNATYGNRIEKYGIVSFVSLIIRLGHPGGYTWKMFIPTWGPTIFIIVAFMAQFFVLRKKMRRSDHISMYVAFAIFTLGISWVIREMTPPELTFPELASLSLAVVYLIALFVTIYTSSHKMDEKNTEEIYRALEAKIDKMGIAVEKLDSALRDTLEVLKKENFSDKRKKTTRRKSSTEKRER